MCADSNKNMILGSDFDQYKAFERDWSHVTYSKYSTYNRYRAKGWN
jgi:hypothetical protein